MGIKISKKDFILKEITSSYLFAEISHLKDYLIKFEGNYSEHNSGTLKDILGADWQKIIEELKSIGFIEFIPKSSTYKIPVIWRKGLNITRAKAFRPRHVASTLLN